MLRIAERLRSGDLNLMDIVAIATSRATGTAARELGIPMLSDDIPRFIDITIDGADEVEPSLDLIKGGGCGGALLREKIVVQASRRQVIVVDDSKLLPRLGTHRALRRSVARQRRCWNLAGARRCACSQALARRSRLAGAVAACFGPIKAT